MEVLKPLKTKKQVMANRIALRLFRRRTNFILAAILFSWSRVTGFIGAVVIAFMYSHDLDRLISHGKVVLAVLALLYLCSGTYFQYWRYAHRHEDFQMRQQKRSRRINNTF